MIKLKSLMSDIAPINAMPFKTKLKTLELATKIGKYVPHPTVQKAAHIAHATVKVVKSVKQSKQVRRIKKRTIKTIP